MAYVASFDYNYDSKLACKALVALPNTSTILQGGDKVHAGGGGGSPCRGGSPGGGEDKVQGEGDKVQGEGTKSRGRGTKWGQGHLAAYVYT